MRASHAAVIAAVLAIPSAAYSQDNGAAGGPVGGQGGVGPEHVLAGAARPFRQPSLCASADSGADSGIRGDRSPARWCRRTCPIMPQRADWLGHHRRPPRPR